jgi:hypothetical protein
MTDVDKQQVAFIPNPGRAVWERAPSADHTAGSPR